MFVFGFMYMVFMIKNMLEDFRMEVEFNKFVVVGFLLVGDVIVNLVEDVVVEEKIVVKKCFV